MVLAFVLCGSYVHQFSVSGEYADKIAMFLAGFIVVCSIILFVKATI